LIPEPDHFDVERKWLHSLVRPHSIEPFTIYHSLFTIHYLPKSAPAILIMPRDLDDLGGDVAPPRFEFLFRDIKRGWGYEVIENDVVLLTPAEGAEVI
jgi:hypothetical protein